MKLRILIATLGVMVLAACGGGQNATPFSLANTSWTLTSITLDGVTQTPPPGSTITFVVAGDGKVSGNAGCNSYSSTLVTQGEIFRLSAISSTLMACEDTKRMEFEGEYLSRLYQGQLFEKKDGQLTITFADGKGRLVFTGG